jgi:adenylate cyclase
VIPVAIEIERKFLVRDTDILQGREGEALRQGYLVIDVMLTVRVRIGDEQAWLTIKGPTAGRSRLEFEYPIPVADAEALLNLAPHPAIEKTRFRIPHEECIWEVDVFEGANAGLVTAEVELEREDQPVHVPQWVGTEVTGDPRYANASLAKHPYGQWREKA